MTGNTVPEIFDAIFGPGSWEQTQRPEPAMRGVRLKIQPTGHLTLAHPKAEGPHIIKIQQVPGAVSAAEVLRRMDRVAVLRRDLTLHFSEIRTGAILK